MASAPWTCASAAASAKSRDFPPRRSGDEDRTSLTVRGVSERLGHHGEFLGPTDQGQKATRDRTQPGQSRDRALGVAAGNS